MQKPSPWLASLQERSPIFHPMLLTWQQSLSTSMLLEFMDQFHDGDSCALAKDERTTQDSDDTPGDQEGPAGREQDVEGTELIKVLLLRTMITTY